MALKTYMTKLRPTPGSNQEPACRIFVLTQLYAVSHVFVRTTRNARPFNHDTRDLTPC